jgi:hypothetical protein
MGSMGQVGAVSVKMEANTSEAAAAIEGVGRKLQETGAKAEAAGRVIDNSISRVARTFDTGTAAGKRLQAMMERMQLAAAQAADKDAEAARAKELLRLKTDAVARANEQLAASAVPVGNAYESMAERVSASMSAVGEKIAATAERAQLSADGVASGFGAMGTALGLGIAGEMIGHFFDDTAENIAKVGDVAMVTKMKIQSLAGLQAVAQSMALPFQTITKGIQMMSAAQMGAAMEWKNASNQQVASFKALGISLQEIQHDTPEEMFYRLTKALHDNSDATLVNAAARRIFGKGATSTLAMIDKYGAGLEGVSKKLGEESGYTNEAYDSSEQWLQMMRQLSMEIHSMAIPALEHLVPLIKDLGDMYTIAMTPQRLFFGEMFQGFATMAKLKGDLTAGDFSGMWKDTKSGLTNMKNLSDIVGAQGHAALMDMHWNTPAEAHSKAGLTDLSGLTPDKKVRAARVPRDKTDYDPLTGLALPDRNQRDSLSEIRKRSLAFWSDFKEPKAVDFTSKQDPRFQGQMDKLNVQGGLIGSSSARNLSLEGISEQGKSGGMTAYQTSVATAAVNLGAFNEKMGILNDHLNELGDSDRDRLERQKTLNEQAELQGRRNIEIMKEQYDAIVKTPLGAGVQGLADYLKQFDGASISSRMAPQTLESANDSVAHLMTTGKGNFAGMFRGIADTAAKNSLGGIEDHFLKGPLSKMLGKMGTKGNPMYVVDANSSGGKTGGMDTSISSLTSLLPTGAGAGGLLSKVGGLFTKALPFISGFLATGGPVTDGLSYMVGEQGPELFTPGRSGSIIPNHQLSQVGGGGGGSTAIHVDARGAMDPAATMAAVQRGIVAMGHQAVKQSMHSAMEMKARTPR